MPSASLTLQIEHHQRIQFFFAHTQQNDVYSFPRVAPNCKLGKKFTVDAGVGDAKTLLPECTTSHSENGTNTLTSNAWKMVTNLLPVSHWCFTYAKALHWDECCDVCVWVHGIGISDGKISNHFTPFHSNSIRAHIQTLDCCCVCVKHSITTFIGIRSMRFVSIC